MALRINDHANYMKDSAIIQMLIEESLIKSR